MYKAIAGVIRSGRDGRAEMTVVLQEEIGNWRPAGLDEFGGPSRLDVPLLERLVYLELGCHTLLLLCLHGNNNA